MSFRVEIDKRQLNDVLKKLEKFGGKKALQKFKNAFNRAGFDTRKRLIDHIGKVFKNPNQYTRNSPYFSQLRIQGEKTIGGYLAFKKKRGGRGVGAGIYLMPQEWGGSRAAKGFEIRLQRMGILEPGMFAIPTKALPKQMLRPAALDKLASDLGKVITRVDSGKRRTRAQRENLFVITRKTGSLSPGIYIRSNTAKTTKLFGFVNKVTYQRILDFYKTANKDFSELFVIKLQDELSKD